MAVQQRLLYMQAFVRLLLLLGQHPHLIEGALGCGWDRGVVCRHKSRGALVFETQNKLLA